MSLSRITVTGVRNLHPVTLSPSSRINILHGANGSGKTSVLEAIHLLGLARSFRSTRLHHFRSGSVGRGRLVQSGYLSRSSG